MGDVIGLQDRQLIENQELIADLCRFRENLLTEKFIRRKYRLDNATWERLGSDGGDALVEKVEEESARRIRDGSAKREKAQKLVVAAPDVLSGILLDNTANARHRIDSCKVLNDLSANEPTAAAGQSDRFIISIILNSDDGGAPHTLHFDKPIKPDVIDDTPQTEWLPVLTTSKKEDGGSGEPL